MAATSSSDRGEPDVERAGARPARPAANSSESPGQKGRDDEAGLGKDDREQERVDPGAVGRHQLEQVAVDVQQQIDEFGHVSQSRLGHV